MTKRHFLSFVSLGLSAGVYLSTASNAAAAVAQQAYLKASNTDAGDYFGQSVGVSGDTVVVGAYGEASTARGVNGNQSNTP